MLKTILTGLFLASLLSSHTYAQSPTRPLVRMWFAPPSPVDPTLLSWQNVALWPATFHGMSVYKAYYQDLPAYTTTDAKSFLQTLTDAKKGFAVEVGAFYPAEVCKPERLQDPYYYDQQSKLPNLGRQGADAEGSAIASTVGTGVDYIVIDGPFERVFNRQLHPNNCVTMNAGVNMEFIAKQLAIYIQRMSARFPKAKFVLLTNFPHWRFTPPGGAQIASITSQGPNMVDRAPNGVQRVLDYKDVLNAAVAEAAKLGIKFDELHIDNPYNFLTQTVVGDSVTATPATAADLANKWARIQGLVSQARSKGLKVGVITNSEQIPELGGTAEAFFSGSVAYSADITSRGLQLDSHIAQSWYKTVPYSGFESVPYSMTSTARALWQPLQAYNEVNFGTIGYVDGVSGGTNLFGWACGKYSLDSLDVHLYTGGPAGSGVFAGAYKANLSSESAVASLCRTTGRNYRYSIPIAGRFAKGTKLYVYGISPVGGYSNMLQNSGAFVSP